MKYLGFTLNEKGKAALEGYLENAFSALVKGVLALEKLLGRLQYVSAMGHISCDEMHKVTTKWLT